MNTYKSIFCPLLLSAMLSSQVVATTILPDTKGSNADNKNWTLIETGPRFAPVTVTPTNNGQTIQNADGSTVQYMKKIKNGTDTNGDGIIEFLTSFTIPGIINGKPTTDAQQKTEDPVDPADPGTLYLSVFDNNGMMTENSLGTWLFDNGYINDITLNMPDFFPEAGQGFSDVYYGVNLAELFDIGNNFVTSHMFGDILTIDANGGLAELSMFTFSSTPLSYISGVGWGGGTDLAVGTQLSFVAFHQASAVAEPSSLMLVFLASLAFCSIRSKRKFGQT